MQRFPGPDCSPHDPRMPTHGPGGIVRAPSFAGSSGPFVSPMVVPDRILRVTGLASIAAGGVGSTVTLQHQEDGDIVGISAVARGDGTAAGQASLAVQISVGDAAEAFVFNGQAADYVLFSSLTGLQGGPSPFPMMRPVKRSEIWQFLCRNYHAANAYTPEITLFLRRGRRVG